MNQLLHKHLRDAADSHADEFQHYYKYLREPLPSAVRSWQKPLAGAIRRIRCHSHPRMLHHHSSYSDPPLPHAAYFLLSCSHRALPPSYFRVIPLFTAFSNHFPSLSSSLLFPKPFFSSCSLFPSWSHHRVTARGPHQNGVIYKPINSGNKLDQRATYSDPSYPKNIPLNPESF